MTWSTAQAAEQLPEQVRNNSVYLYVLLVIAVLVLVISFAAKYIPVVGKTIDAWNARRRRSAKATKSADVADLREQVAHFEERVARMEGESERWRTTLAAHREWDYEAVEVYLAFRIGQQPTKDLPLPPPPLYPPPMGPTS